MAEVGKVDYFDGVKRKLYFFVGEEDSVEEEGFYKVDTGSKFFYIFVTNLEEKPLDSEIGARFNREDFAYDTEERFLLYAHASVLLEHRKGKITQNIIGYKTIPRHGNPVITLDTTDFDILKLPKLDFAHVRSGSKQLETTAGFNPKAYITHWLLSGWTNSGKTNAAKVLLGVTIKGNENGSFAGGVIIDPHGEYYRGHENAHDGLRYFNTVKNPKVFHFTLNADRSDSCDKTLKVSSQNVWPGYLTEVYDFREDTQVNLMHHICNLKSRGWVKFILRNSMEDILKELPKERQNEMVLMAVKNRMQGIFNSDPDVWEHDTATDFIATILDGVPRGNWYVIDVSSISEKTTKVITAMLANGLFKKYKKDKINKFEQWKAYKPAGILVEEAHNYLSPEETSKGNVIAKIAKEGRKFNVFSIIVEQDPSAIDSRILKQVHNKITLQLIPIDARAIVDTTPYMAELQEKIPTYETGEGVFVSTGSFNFALPVKFPLMDDWIKKNSGLCKKCGKEHTFDSDGVCDKCQKTQKGKDIEAFM